MANNRLQLRCICGAERFIARRLLDGYYVPDLDDQGGAAGYVERLNQFLSEHAQCGNGLDHFAISYEHAADYDIESTAPTGSG